MPHLVDIALGAILAAIISASAFRLRALSTSGAIAACFVGTIVFGIGGWAFAWPLLTFFITSTALSRWRRGIKEGLGYAKVGRRDAGQVLANGGVAAVIAAASPYVLRHSNVDLYPLYLAALSAANADTWATEIGSAVGGRPLSLGSLRQVPPGMSGAVSLAGTLGAAGGAAAIASFALIFRPPAAWLFLCPALAGLAGAMFDSLLGATLQAHWQVAGDPLRLTEKPISGEPPIRGFGFMNNDVVNFISVLIAAIFAWFLR